MHTVELENLGRQRQDELLREAARERLVATVLAARQQVPPPQPWNSLKGRVTWARALLAAGVRALVKLATAPVRRGRRRTVPLSFADDARRAGLLTRRLPRTVAVDIAQVVGSVGRSRELGADFRPTSRGGRHADTERFRRVRAAMRQDKPLPLIELYQLGSAYYVLDGHHRVAAALDLGQLAIDASVIEHIPTAAVGLG